jgi:hypothetical protein
MYNNFFKATYALSLFSCLVSAWQKDVKENQPENIGTTRESDLSPPGFCFQNIWLLFLKTE